MGLNDTAEQLDVCRQQSLRDEARIRELEQELTSAAANLTAAADAIARIAALCESVEQAQAAITVPMVFTSRVRAALGDAAPGVVPAWEPAQPSTSGAVWVRPVEGVTLTPEEAGRARDWFSLMAEDVTPDAADRALAARLEAAS